MTPDTEARPAEAERRQRPDAKRNAAALLEAAKTVFAEAGVDAPAKQITDLAGVGVGTLYRHFPRRSDLIAAVLQREIDACADAAVTLAARQPPWEALTMWVDRLVALVSTKRGLSVALHSGDPAYRDLPRYIMRRLEPALGRLLGAAQDSGQVTAPITPREIILAVALMCQPVPGEDPSYNKHIIRIFVNGLRSA